MDSSKEKELTLLSVILFFDKSRRNQAKKFHFWVCEILQPCQEPGVFQNLVNELHLGDIEFYFK